ncbi:hypothetical protein [Microbacterium sp. 2RAF4]|uniref:hypothetical protein n=1 Tax=Microbacterium sp. 2RAF4 TaxID=3232999 RepID=UPI003F947397
MSTNIRQTRTKKDRLPFLIASAAAFALLASLLTGWLTPANPSAALSNGGFCVPAYDRGDPDIKGMAGAKGCDEAPATPSVPLPDYNAAGICAAPGADRAIYSIGAGGIKEYSVAENGTITATGKSYAIPTATGNALGLTRSGEFYYNDTNRIYGGTPDAISPKSTVPQRYVAGEAMVYNGVSEHYYGLYTYGDLEIYRYSPTADRSGPIATVETHNTWGSNGDFGFDRNGDLRFLVSGGGKAAIGLVKFSEFAELEVNTKTTLPSSIVKEWDLDRATVANGITYLPGDLLAISTSAGIQIVNGTDGSVVSSLAATGLTDLANCR